MPSRTSSESAPGPLLYSRHRGRFWPLRTTDPPDLSWGGGASASIVTDDELAHSWRRIRTELRTAVSDATWHLYLDALDARRLDGSTLVVTAPDASRAWVTERFSRMLQAGAQRVLGQEVAVRLVGPEDPVAASEAAAAGHPLAVDGRRRPLQRPLHVRPVRHRRLQPARPRRRARGRRDAGARLQPAVHLRPARARQDAPAALDRQLRRGLRRRADRPLHDRRGVHQPLHRRAAPRRHRRFKSAYRDVGVLLVDDVQFLQRKAKTEEEFFHTFNALHAAGAQIVLTSDRLPRDMAALEDRLRERFEAGLVCDVRPPDYDTRLTILRKRVQQDGVRAVDAGGARADRRAGRLQRPRARGRADPDRRVRLADGPPGHRRARRGGPRRPLSRPAAAGAVGRGDPAPHLPGLRDHDRRACSPTAAPPA